jgi:hypothetical protein
MLEAFEPVLIRTPGETSQAKNRKNLPTTYGGMRQTCMRRWRRRLQRRWRLMESVPTGSAQLPAEAGRYSIIMRHSDCGTRAIQTQLQGFRLGCTLLYNTILHVGFRPTTISLLWRGRKPTCNIALYSATLPYVIRIVTTGQRLKMSSCDRGLFVFHNSMQVFPPPTPIPR